MWAIPLPFQASACFRRSIPPTAPPWPISSACASSPPACPWSRSTPRSSPAINFIARTKDAYVYENPRALPRVMLLTDWRLANFDELLRVGWPSVDPRRTVLLKKAPIGFSPSAAAGTVGSARLLRYANTEVVVEAESPAGGILLLNDIWHPWWRASIDGADAEILKADVIFRAVVCPRGRHEIRFTFHPFAGALAEVVGKVTHNARP